MAERSVVTLLLALLLASCAAPRAQPAHDALSRFDELLLFLPDDMQSYWFRDRRGLEGADHNDLRSDVLEAVAAGDFEAPTSVGLGIHRFVKVRLRGADAAPPSIDEWSGEGSEQAPDAPIGDRPVWRVSGQWRQTEWVAFVDDRLTLTASSPQLLAAALQRASGRKGLLRSMPPLAALADDAHEILLLRPRPQPDEVPNFRPGIYCGGPSPRAPMLAQAWLRADGSYDRLQLQSARAEELTDFVRVWSGFARLAAGAMRQRDGLHVVEFDLQGDLGICIWLLFGLHVFI